MRHKTSDSKNLLNSKIRVREVIQEVSNAVDSGEVHIPCALTEGDLPLGLIVDMNPPAQGFPDVVLGDVGVRSQVYGI